MALIEAYISVSADGYVTGPRLDREPGLGEGGSVLHEWFAHAEGRPYLDELFAVSGAVVTSRKVYEITGGWGEDGLYRMPVFVVTHRPENQVVKGETTFTFVTDGIDAALTQAGAPIAGPNRRASRRVHPPRTTRRSAVDGRSRGRATDARSAASARTSPLPGESPVRYRSDGGA
jgi:hypothetical protein